MPIDGAASIWVVATRVTALDANTFAPDPGTLCYTTDTLMKLTYAPKVESGDSITQKNAAGNLAVANQHDDIPWLGQIQLDLATPNEILEGILAGGTTTTASGAALGTPTGLAATAQATAGTLAAGVYGYRAAQYNAYGQSTAENDVSATTTGTTGAVVLSGLTFAAGAYGVYIFGRTIGNERFIGIIPNLGSQATSVASGTGTVTSLTVTALTQSIPLGTTFQITGDTNTTKITFTTTAFAPVGAVTIPVSTSPATVTTTIAAAAIIPVLMDTGATTPGAAVQSTDTTAGPGLGAGLLAPTLGVSANPPGVSLECWTYSSLIGTQAFPYPYRWFVFPRVTGLYRDSTDLTNASMATPLKGYARPNANWGTGPLGTWPIASTSWWQRTRCGAEMVPAVSLTGVAATA
jgi:hypothetical protein